MFQWDGIGQLIAINKRKGTKAPKVMKIIPATLVTILVFVLGGGKLSQAQTSPEREIAQIAAQSQEALDQHDDKKALSVVEEGLRRFPGNEDLECQMAAVYAYQHRDRQAAALLREVLARNPSSRLAKLELAQLHGYRGEYKESDALYRELLAVNAEDETAVLGLIHNLILEGKRTEARALAQQALQRHPNSIELQQYDDYLAKSAGSAAETPITRQFGRGQVSESVFADSDGNHATDSYQSLFFQFTRNLSNRVRMEETALWKSNTPNVTVVSGSDEVRYRINKFVTVRGSGGAVRYADTSSKFTASGDLELFPIKSLTVSGGYSRFPVTPTFDATLFDLLSEGWHGRVEFRPMRNLTLAGNFSLTHISDGNRAEREWGEVMRWFNLKGDTVSLGAGYAFRHLHFAQELAHGYFSPNQYWSHLGGGGVRVKIGKHYRGELLGYGGAENQDAGAYTPAGEGILRNDFIFGKWDLVADYSYYHLAQATGAFHAHSGTVSLGYRF